VSIHGLEIKSSCHLNGIFDFLNILSLYTVRKITYNGRTIFEEISATTVLLQRSVLGIVY